MIIKSIKDTIKVICILVGVILLISISVMLLFFIGQYILFPIVKWIAASKIRIIVFTTIFAIISLFLFIYEMNRNDANKREIIPLLSKSEKICVFCLIYSSPRCSKRYDEMTLLTKKESNISHCRYFEKDEEKVKTRKIKLQHEKECFENKTMK